MWLTAWIVSYMTLRLARRVLSHCVPTCSGRARMRLPSFSAIVLTIAEGTSSSLRVIRRIWLAISAAATGRSVRAALKTRIDWPSVMWSPGFSGTSLIGCVLTCVPFALPKSRRWKPPFCGATSACLRLTSVSCRTRRLVRSRPIDTGPSAGKSNCRPSSGPLMTINRATSDPQACRPILTVAASAGGRQGRS